MRAKRLPSAELLRERFDYKPETGELSYADGVSIPGVSPGLKAGYFRRGYICVKIDGREYQVHRVAWKIMTGEDPVNQIDHRDRQKTNNKWNNLRDATPKENCANRDNGQYGSFVWGPRQPRRSGYRGVICLRNKFYARIKVDGKSIGLGFHARAEDAFAAYVDAARRFYGEKARV